MDQVGVYNMAIGRIGQSQFVQSLTEMSNQRITCDVFFENCRDRVLTAFPWNFAAKPVALSALGTPPNGWRYRYAYPSDCLKARAVVPTLDMTTSPFIIQEILRYGFSDSFPFKVIEDVADGSKAIASNLPTAFLWYTARITNLDLWTPDATSALSWLLATEIAGPLSAQPNYTKQAGEAYAMAIREAGTNSLNEGKPNPDPETDLVTVRY